MKNHIQYFLFQYRKLSKEERGQIINRMGYLTNASKSNQRSFEWKASDEFKQIQKVKIIVSKRLKEDPQIYFPNDPLRQELYCDKYFFTYIGEETKKIRTEFNNKCSVK